MAIPSKRGERHRPFSLILDGNDCATVAPALNPMCRPRLFAESETMSSTHKHLKAAKPDGKERSLGFTMITLIVVVLVVAVAWIIWANSNPRSENTVIAGQHPTAAIQRISPKLYRAEYAQTDAPHLLVDVRTPEEFATGHIAGAVNISLQSLPQRMDSLPKDQPIVLYCRSGNRSNTAAQMLARAGYTQVYDLGGIIDWRAQGLPLQ